MYPELSDGELEARANDDERQMQLAIDNDLEQLRKERVETIEEIRSCQSRMKSMSHAIFCAHDNPVLQERSAIVDELSLNIESLESRLKQIGEDIRNHKSFVGQTA